MRRSSTVVAALAVLVLAPTLASAQPASQFTGVVTDNTGGILPGVTVEAASPALIEGSRVAISDGAGRYLLVDLRPGVYTITFTLPGFSTVVVEQQELPAGFTATVDAELSVGALEETVTVSGEAPVVDVQAISQAEVLDREVLDAIPTGRNLQSTAQLIPGVKMNRPEVGLTTAAQQTYMSVHGMSARQTTVMVDGQLVMSSGGDGGVQNYNNQLAASEMVYETSGISAETSTGGVRISMIPREGGNTHSGQNYFGFANNEFGGLTLQADNHHQRLKDRGLTAVESLDYVYDLNVAHGGPIIRDKLWFFGSGRRFSINVPVTDSFYKNEDGTAPRYMQAVKYPDGTDGLRQGLNDDRITSGLLRLTWQMSQNNKFSAYMDRIIKQRFHDYDARVDVGTASRHHGSPIYYVGAAKWTSTLSSRLLLEAGYSTNVENWSNVDQEADVPDGPGLGLRGGAVGPHTQAFDPSFPTCVATPCYPGVDGYPALTDPGVMAQYSGGVDGGGIHPFYANTLRRDTTHNFADRYHWGNRYAYVERFNYNASVSYVTGSHNLKVGLMSSWGPFRLTEQWNGALRQRYRDAIPYQIRRGNHPVDYSLGYRDVAAYAQDTWTIDRLTLNLGLRWETVNGTVDPTNRLSPTRFTMPATLPGKENIPDWTNVAPRIGLAYDLFGDASTALKFSWGRYNASVTHSLADRLHTGKIQNAGLAWFDCAMITTRHGSASNRCATLDEINAISPGLGDLAYGGSGLTDWGAAKPEGSVPNHGTNGDGYVQDWELGIGPADFGQGTSTAILDPNGIDRPWVGLTNLGIERELWPGLSASFNYYRRDSYGALLEVNRALSLSDYTRFQLANPCAADPTPGGGGFGCTTNGSAVPATLPVYVLNPDAQGRSADPVYTNTNADTGYTETYNGFESGFNARLPNGTTLFGAYTFERNIMTRCDSQDNPNELLFCDRSGASPITGQDVGPAYDLPWLHEFKLSGTVPLPGDFQVSATLQSYTPRELLATTSYAGDSASGLNGGGGLWGSLLALGNVGYTVQASEIEAAGVPFTGSPFIPLMPPGSTYLDRLNQFDVSFRKIFELPGGQRLNVQADVYNLLNGGPILQAVNTHGGSLGLPQRTIQGRFLQIATHLYW